MGAMDGSGGPARMPVPPESGDPSIRDVQEIAAELGVDLASGLSSAEAARRLAAEGPNELREAPGVPLWRRVLAQFRSPLVILLIVAIVISLLAWVAEGAPGVPIDALVILAVIVLNAVLGLVQEGRAEMAVAALRKMVAANSTVLRDGHLASVPSTELVRGDVLALAEGDSVGADARLVSVSALRVSEASLTGESEAVTKDPGRLPAPAQLGDRVDMVFKGTQVSRGVGRAIVTATGMDTEMGAIAELLERTRADDTPLQKEIATIGRVLGIAVLAIAAVVMVVTAWVSRVDSLSGLVTVLLLGVSLAVAAVPEGLPAILSVVLAIGVMRMSRRNAVVKELNSVETLGSASVIASDKTGTLTKNEMTAVRVVTASGSFALTGVGYRPEGTALYDGPPDAEAAALLEAREVLTGGSLTNDAQVFERDGEWHVQGDPTEGALVVAARKLEGIIEHVGRFEQQAQIPFSSERKLMSSVQRRGHDGWRAVMTKGAPDVLLGRCVAVQHGDEVVPLEKPERMRLLADVEALSAQALRTIAVAYRPLGEESEVLGEELEHDLVYVGVVGITDPPRPEAAPAIAEAHRAGIRVLMITGDHPATAARIAVDLGIIQDGDRAATGKELDELDEDGWRETTRAVSVYARVAPQHKLRIVDALQADGQVVAMTGDGVNDAPALKSADIGIAMGITGSEVTKEASKMILADDDFATIVAAVRQGRVILQNITKFLRYLLSSNMGEVMTVFFGVMFAGVLGLSGASAEPVVLPLLATQILWINLVTDSTPALAMGVDPEIDDVMARPPRRVDERVLDRGMWATILSIGLVTAIVTLATIDLFLPGGLIPGGSETLVVARTGGFTTLVFAVLLTTLTSRSATTSAFRGLFQNRWLWGALGLSALLQVAVVELPFLQLAFGTASLAPWQWAACLAMASAVFWFDELRKLILRAWIGARVRSPLR